MSLRIVGYSDDEGAVWVGTLHPDGQLVTTLGSVGDFWRSPREHMARPASGSTRRVTDVKLVPPVLPSARVMCVGLNYREHVAEGTYKDDQPVPYPTIFGRWTSSLSVSGGRVRVPLGEPGLDWEGEVVAWVGDHLTDVDAHEALAAVIGYSTFNDMTARTAQKLTSQWTLGKNGDGTGPLGPMIPADHVGDLRDGLSISTRVNGAVMQSASTADMIHTVGETLSLLSRCFTLHPGDLLATGTPSGVGYARTPPQFLGTGDVVEVEVEKLGTLRTTIA